MPQCVNQHCRDSSLSDEAVGGLTFDFERISGEIATRYIYRSQVSKGFKVCRVEQTETPDQVKKRIAGRRGLSKIEKGMRREVCSLTTPGTRLYTVLDMRLEKEGGGFEPVSGPTHSPLQNH